MKKTSSENLISALKKEGLIFTDTTMVTEGNYCAADADWNYKDVPHLNEIHQQVDGIVTAIGDDIITSLFMQKVGPLRIPLTVVNYSDSFSSQSYYTTLGPFCLVIKTHWTELGVIRTQVSTTYSLGSPIFWRPVHALIHRLLKRNYLTLMSEDIPMRERRGKLREAGYKFKSDENGYSFLKTLNIQEDNLMAPLLTKNLSWKTKLSDISEGRNTIGDDEVHGLVVERAGSKISFFNRSCQHEGALLDAAVLYKNCLRCPWHGRTISPLASLDLDNSPSKVKAEKFMISVSDGYLMVSFY